MFIVWDYLKKYGQHISLLANKINPYSATINIKCSENFSDTADGSGNCKVKWKCDSVDGSK